MNATSVLLASLHQHPADDTAWLALADALEEAGQPDRAELTRLSTRLRHHAEGPDRDGAEARLRELLAQGTEPCIPEAVNSVGMRFALVPPGSFLMGSPGPRPAGGDEAGGDEGEEPTYHEDERPRHEVRFARAIYLGVFPVTQQEYRRVTGINPSAFSRQGDRRNDVRGLDTDRFPVDGVSWTAARDLTRLLSNLPDEHEAGRTYRLPTEAEWEYACRAGTTTQFAFGDDLGVDQACFDGEHPFGQGREGPNLDRPVPVGSFAPNAFGLYDMHGLIWEWCRDWYGRDYYARSPADDPRGPARGSYRVLRGGAWYEFATDCRSAYRLNRAAEGPRDVYGLRLVMEVRRRGRGRNSARGPALRGGG